MSGDVAVSYCPIWLTTPDGEMHGPFVREEDIRPLLDRLEAAEAKVERAASLVRIMTDTSTGYAAWSRAFDDLRAALTEEDR